MPGRAVGQLQFRTAYVGWVDSNSYPDLEWVDSDSYPEGQPGNEARNQPATVAAWFLVSGGYRREVMPQQPDQDDEELDRMLAEWLEANMFAESA